ncbi:MAG: alpha/beta fold hydrolase [Myxococcota bacterium]
MRFVDEGQGPAVVMIHGFASSLETWDAVRPLLAAQHRVLAMDLKGFGWTDRPPGDYSPEAQADLVLGLMDKQGIAKAAFVGHSYNASVVLAIARKAPARVTKIVLYDAWVYAAQLPTFFHLAKVDGFGEVMFAAWYKERAEDRLAMAFHDPRFVMTQELVDAVLGRSIVRAPWPPRWPRCAACASTTARATTRRWPSRRSSCGARRPRDAHRRRRAPQPPSC